MNNVVKVDASAINNIITNTMARKYVYGTVVLFGVLLGAVQVAFGDTAPSWLDAVLRVYVFVSALTSGLALTNTPTVVSEDESDSSNDTSEDVFDASEVSVEENEEAVSDDVNNDVSDSVEEFASVGDTGDVEQVKRGRHVAF